MKLQVHLVNQDGTSLIRVFTREWPHDQLRPEDEVQVSADLHNPADIRDVSRGGPRLCLRVTTVIHAPSGPVAVCAYEIAGHKFKYAATLLKAYHFIDESYLERATLFGTEFLDELNDDWFPMRPDDEG